MSVLIASKNMFSKNYQNCTLYAFHSKYRHTECTLLLSEQSECFIKWTQLCLIHFLLYAFSATLSEFSELQRKGKRIMDSLFFFSYVIVCSFSGWLTQETNASRKEYVRFPWLLFFIKCHCHLLFFFFKLVRLYTFFSIHFLNFSSHSEWHVGLVPWPGVEPTLPVLEAQSLNHWTL